MAKRIGPMMKAAQDYARHNPGCPKVAIAKFVGPHGSTGYGTRTVERAIAAGLIRAIPSPSGHRYSCYAV